MALSLHHHRRWTSVWHLKIVVEQLAGCKACKLQRLKRNQRRYIWEGYCCGCMQLCRLYYPSNRHKHHNTTTARSCMLLTPSSPCDVPDTLSVLLNNAQWVIGMYVRCLLQNSQHLKRTMKRVNFTRGGTQGLLKILTKLRSAPLVRAHYNITLQIEQ